MYNRVTMMGRIANDLEIKTTQSGTSVLTFRLAVDRSYKDADGNRDTDFFNFVAWRSNADFIAKFFDKGRLILLDAEAQNRTYTDKNGTERLVTEFLVNRVYFTGEKANNANTGHSTPSTAVVASTPAPASANSSNPDFNAPEDDYPF
jgi:single-strand DNA-binding protein|nr:MAG TPA: Single strand binding protein [Caudoviricetes sp.]